MSGEQQNPFLLDEEDEALYENIWEQDIEVQRFDSGLQDRDNTPEYIEVDADDDLDAPIPEHPSNAATVFPTVIELPSLTLKCGVVRPRDTIEMEGTTERDSNSLISGDFLRIEKIIEDVETGEVKLRGYRLRRENTLRPQFKGKLNELYMLIQAKADDPRSYMEQGVEEILPQSIVCKRDCIFTNLAYPALNFRCANSWVPASVATPQMRYGQIFQFGRLVCRKVNIVVYDRNGRTYGGEILDIKKSQCDPVPESLSPFSPQPSQSSQDDEDWEIVDPPKRVVPDKRRQRSNSIEICEASSLRPRAMPSMIPKCTFGDVFCGAGGTTQGAVQAGLQPLWALDNNETAIATYAANFPEALPLLMNAHDFPTYATRRGFKVNICHFSCPCKFWSSAHTRPGKHDQANLETIFVPEPAIDVLKPEVLTFEQAPGLIMNQEHRLYFRGLIGGIVRCGYNVRYKIVDLVEYGVPQRRRRLIIIAARKGIPLPPFPKPSHGPPGSGLRPFVTVYDALEPLRRRSPWIQDKYHQPDTMKEYNRPAHDPKKLLVNCITTDGGDNFHYTGSRKNTVREVGVYQTFPISFIWKGSHTTAMECAGNAVPPRAYEPIALNCAATLEAYRHGFIDADEEIDDLFETLTARGVIIPGTNSAPINLVDGDSQARAPTNPYRYINRLQPWKGRGKYTNHSLWSRKIDLNRPEPEKKRERRVHPNFGLFGGVSDEPAPTPRIERRLQSVHTEIEGLTSAKANGELMELD